MAKVEFRSNYDHVWPSRAVTAYKAGWSGTVKQEVADAAQAAGALVGSRTPSGPAELPRNVPKLRVIARDEGIDVGEARTADDYITAIEAARKVTATPPSPTSATPQAPGARITEAPALSNGDVSE